MGGHPYTYIADYRGNAQQSLEDLQQRELHAGRYYPRMEFPNADVAPRSGAHHSSVADARRAAGATGTRSILDVVRISQTPDYCVAAPFDDDVIEAVLRTKRPSREHLTDDHLRELLDFVERGTARYVVAYRGNDPTHICFVGYSLD